MTRMSKEDAQEPTGRDAALRRPRAALDLGSVSRLQSTLIFIGGHRSAASLPVSKIFEITHLHCRPS